ncbi:MAG TPA: UPF0280 family protein [Terriglobales bacterium]|nr:UPF0280 family protein [Terriglobales bacterium]
MKNRAQIRFLPDGRRLHLHDGPIDIVLEAFGPPTGIEAAYRAAADRFVTVLDELCAELPNLRTQAGPHAPHLTGAVAKRMAAAVTPYADRWFITPMAAVAGAVAEEVLAAMTSAAHLDRAYVNDGGDIALHLDRGHFVAGMIDDPEGGSLFGSALLEASQPVRGIATSGWRGRSFSLGIADAVTVLADRAAMADVAATIIANAVDLPDHPNIQRVPARDLAPDNDLGDRLVTQRVGPLESHDVDHALTAGVTTATTLLVEGLIRAAALHLCGQTRMVGGLLQLSSQEGTSGDRGLVHA